MIFNIRDLPRAMRCLVLAGPIVLIGMLTACGGGDSTDSARERSSPAAARTTSDNIVVDSEAGTVSFAESANGSGTLGAATPLAAGDKEYLAYSSSEVEAAGTAKQTPLAVAGVAHRAAGVAQAQATNPLPCKVYRFGGVQACLQRGPDVYTWSGTGPASIPGVIPGCMEVTVGTKYSLTTPAAGGQACFQYVLNASTTVSSQVILPASITAATVELFAELPNTAGFKVALSQRPSNPFNVSATSAYTRHVLMVRPGNGLGGEVYNIGIGVPADPLPAAVNDDPSRPTVLEMNETVAGTINPSGQSDFYYFFPTTPGQTSAQFLPTFTANQNMAWRRFSRSAAGAYTPVGTETVMPGSASGNVQQLTGLTATASGAGTTHGVMLHVSKKAPYASAAQSFSARVGVKTGYLADFPVWNNEGLDRIYDVASGLEQAFSYIGVNLTVRDANGRPVKGEALTVTVFQDEKGAPSAPPINGTTDALGKFTVSPSLVGCPSSATPHLNYTASSPGEHWQVVGVPGMVVLKLPNAAPITPNVGGDSRTVRFYRVCSETYLGRY